MKGVITKLENVVKSSPSYQNKCSSCQADPGSSDFPVLSSESEINFCERSKEKVPQVLVVKDAVTEENELAFEKSKKIVDTSDKSDNAVELTKCCESSTSISPSETNGKQEDNDTDLVSLVDVNSIENETTLEAARDTLPTESCDEKYPLSFCDSNAVSEVTKSAIDSICFPFSSDSSIISVSIDGHEFPCLVDTGAAVTAVNADVWNKYLSDAYSNLSSSNVGVVTSVDGFPLKILGKALMKFDVQSEVFPCEAHVIEGLTYDVILGRDFLQKYSSKIDFDKAVIEFSSKENPFPFCGLETLNFDEEHLPDDTSFVCTVHADFSFVIPPESEVVVPAVLNCLPQRPHASGLVAPRSTLPEKYSVFGASELVRVSDDGKIPIRMINPSAQPVKIYRRTKLGDFEQVDPSVATFELKPSESSSPSPQPSSTDSQRDYSEFPDL